MSTWSKHNKVSQFFFGVPMAVLQTSISSLFFFLFTLVMILVKISLRVVTYISRGILHSYGSLCIIIYVKLISISELLKSSSNTSLRATPCSECAPLGLGTTSARLRRGKALSLVYVAKRNHISKKSLKEGCITYSGVIETIEV